MPVGANALKADTDSDTDPDSDSDGPWFQFVRSRILRIAVRYPSMTQVALRKPVEKQLDCIPEVIIRKFRLWVSLET
jgi:hypothetical protein